MSDKGLLGTTDAMVWAEEFCRIFAGKEIRVHEADGAVDVGTMVGWFANAMAVGEREGKQAVCPHTDVIGLTDDLSSCGICGKLFQRGVWGPDSPGYDEMGQ